MFGPQTNGGYWVERSGDMVVLADTRANVVVRVLTTASKAYQMTVYGHDVLRRKWETLGDIRGSMGLNGVPLLWPYANRLDEQAFYANGQRYAFDAGLGNTGSWPIPLHGFLTDADAWRVVRVGADADGAFITSQLEFFRIPRYMRQFPFAHILTMTYRLQSGALEVHTRIDSLSDEPMPVAIGFHPYFQLTDSPPEDWRLSIGARTHWLLDGNTIPTGETEPITAFLPAPERVMVRDIELDDLFTDLERDGSGLATVSLSGPSQCVDVVVGPNFKAMLVFSRVARRGVATNDAALTTSTSGAEVALEPMAAISNAMNLAHRGLYNDLQSVEPGGSWEERFWIRPQGFRPGEGTSSALR